MAQIYPQKIAVVLDDQSWTYGELIEQIERVVGHLCRLNIVQGQIIYQFVERGFELICGFFGIMCAGGVYCPLNPTDPVGRLATIIEQTQGQYVLLHTKTCSQFSSTADLHVVLFEQIFCSWPAVEDMYDLPDCTELGAAYIICTSGTTGRPKAIVHTYRSFSAGVLAYIQWHFGIYTIRDQVLQVATCSWVLHLLEIPLALVVGGTLVLLRPDGHLDMSYFSQTLIHQQVTTLTIGPGIIRALTNYLQMSQKLKTFEFVRNLCTTGEAVKREHWTTFIGFLTLSKVRVFILFGMSECNGALGCQLLDIDDTDVPIGRSFPGVQCLLIDEQGQIISSTSNTNEIGQIHIGGLTLFNCYLNDPERTTDTLVSIDNKLFMKTGDLARFNARGELVYAGRIDFQIKVRGQRVETAEIEKTIMNWSPSKISNCLVTKAPENDDLLVAYVVSDDLELGIEGIQDYCSKHLRQYMVPSYIVILDKLPLNANGKVDRKQLPLPSISCDALANVARMEDQPMSELEEKVHSLWCSMLGLDAVPRDMNCFALGGTSLLLMELFNYYQVHLAPDKQLHVLDFFISPTIAKHVQVLKSSETKTHTVWSPLHLVQGRASYAQESVWLAERTRFIQQKPAVPPYNTCVIYRITSGHLPIEQCLRAIDLIVTRHMVLRTRLIFNIERGYLEQSIIQISPDGRRLYPVHMSTVESEQECKALGFQEVSLSLGDAVFRCHFIRWGHINQDALKQDDIVMFTFHHGSFDGTAVDLFFDELALAYSGSYDLEKPLLQYIDYAAYERTSIDMNAAKDYWHKVLQDYPWNRQLDLPYDFGVPTNARRSGRCWFVATSVSTEITDAMINRAKDFNATLLQLTLACFYIFLAQLSPNNQDSCVIIPIENRYRSEFKNIIGMFVNMLPCRVTFDASSASTVTFVDLLHKVQNNLINMIQYGELPYLELLELHRIPNINIQLPFLHAYFALILGDGSDLGAHQLNLSSPFSNEDSCSLAGYYQSNDPGDENIFISPNMFDTDVTIYVNVAKKKTILYWTYSTDLFTYNTIDMLSKRFICLFGDLFVTTPLQQLDTIPLVKLIPIANEPINLWVNRQQEQLNRTTLALTSLEQHIQAIFARVLDREQIDVNKSFFEQGGTSVKALQAIYLLQENPMTAMVDANLFFATLSVIRLAQTIEASRL